MYCGYGPCEAVPRSRVVLRHPFVACRPAPAPHRHKRLCAPAPASPPRTSVVRTLPSEKHAASYNFNASRGCAPKCVLCAGTSEPVVSCTIIVEVVLPPASLRWTRAVGGSPSGRRRNCLILAVLWSLLLMVSYMFLGEVTRALLVPPPTQDLIHFRRTKSLDDYLNDIEVLIEPSSVSCSKQVLVLVASAPLHHQQREAIRLTWGKYLQTYFVLGRHGHDEEMVDNYVEAKKYGDIIMYDLRDHYQNLTLKSVLMLQWTRDRCPGVDYLFKTDDDVLVNPWLFEKVVKEHPDADLLGYMRNKSYIHRDPYNKWFVPRWLHNDDYLPRYLSGTGYIIKGSRIAPLLKEAKRVPLINLEDVYLTYLVASRLNYTLVHDYRLSPFKPWINLDCAYWTLGSIHSLEPVEMVHAWSKIKKLSKLYTKNPEEVCSFYKKHIESEYLLF